jgi:hypothetical protein
MVTLANQIHLAFFKLKPFISLLYGSCRVSFNDKLSGDVAFYNF